MKRIVFLCHGNICRSPAAEMICKALLDKHGLSNRFSVSSYALTMEEIGNPIYPPMRRALEKAKIPLQPHYAQRFTPSVYDEADYIFYMDKENAALLRFHFSDPKGIIEPISLYTENIDEIEDPWYTGRYEKVVQELRICIEDILERLL